MKTIGKFGPALGIFLGLALVAGCGSSQDEGLGGSSSVPAMASAMGTGEIEGKVTLEGRPPKPAFIDFSADPVCKARHTQPVGDDSVKVGRKGGLADAFVYVKAGAGAYKAPATPVTLTQEGCMYRPHVFGIQAGQPLEIVNADPTLHNIHCLANVNGQFNVGQPTQGMRTEKKFDKPEVMVKFKCDVHSWMHCYAGVLTNPFYGVSSRDGAYEIKGLLPGSYTVEAWQEKYGTVSQKVDLKQGEVKKVDFAFAAQ